MNRLKLKNSNNNVVINIISYVVLIIIFYLGFMYYRDVSLTNVIVISISTVFSFAITLYVSDRFQFSNNKYIKYLQKFILMNIILALFSSLLYIFDFQFLNTIFNASSDVTEGDSSNTENSNNNKASTSNNNDRNNNDQTKDNNKEIVGIRTTTSSEGKDYYNFNVRKEAVDGAIEKVKELGSTVVGNFVPELGVGAAAGNVAGTVFKHTAGLPVAARLATTAAAAGGTAFATKVGIEMAKAVSSNKTKLKEIDTSKPKVNKETDSDDDNSPSSHGGGFIYSVLDDNEIPLIMMVNGF